MKPRFIEIVEEQETFEFPMGASTFVLRRVDTEVYRDIEQRHTRRHKNVRKGGWFEEQDNYAINADLFDYMIVGWRSVKSPLTGKDVACTREIKLKLPSAVKVAILEVCDGDSITGGGPEADTGEKKTRPSGSS